MALPCRVMLPHLDSECARASCGYRILALAGITLKECAATFLWRGGKPLSSELAWPSVDGIRALQFVIIGVIKDRQSQIAINYFDAQI